MEFLSVLEVSNGLERRLQELKEGQLVLLGQGGGRYVRGTIEMALVWEPAQALACYRFPLTLRQSPLPVLAPHMEPGGPKPLSGGLTRGIPSGEGRRAWRGLLLEWGPSLSHVQGL